MKTLSIVLTLTLSGIALYPIAVPAQTDDFDDAALMQSSDVEVAATDTRDNNEAMTDKSDTVLRVINSEGDVYFNHYVDRSNLAKVSTDIDVIETYNFTYKGRVYKNKIVEFGDDQDE